MAFNDSSTLLETLREEEDEFETISSILDNGTSSTFNRVVSKKSKQSYSKTKAWVECWLHINNKLKRLCTVFEDCDELTKKLDGVLEHRSQPRYFAFLGRTGCGKSSLLNRLFFEGRVVFPEGRGARSTTPFTISLHSTTKKTSFWLKIKYVTGPIWSAFRRVQAKRLRDSWESKQSDDVRERRELLQIFRSWYPEFFPTVVNECRPSVEKMSRKDFVEPPKMMALFGTESIERATNLEELAQRLAELIHPTGTSHLILEVELHCYTEHLPPGVIVVDTPGSGDTNITRDLARSDAIASSTFNFYVCGVDDNAASTQFASALRGNGLNYAIVITKCDHVPLHQSPAERNQVVRDDFKATFLEDYDDGEEQEAEVHAVPPNSTNDTKRVPSIVLTSSLQPTGDYAESLRRMRLIFAYASRHRYEKLRAIRFFVKTHLRDLITVVQAMKEGTVPSDTEAVSILADLKDTFFEDFRFNQNLKLPYMYQKPLADRVGQYVDQWGRLSHGPAAWTLKRYVNERQIVSRLVDPVLLDRTLSPLVKNFETLLSIAIQSFSKELERKITRFQSKAGLINSRFPVRDLLDGFKAQLARYKNIRLRLAKFLRDYLEGLPEIKKAYRLAQAEFGRGYTDRVSEHFRKAFSDFSLPDFMEQIEAFVYKTQEKLFSLATASSRSLAIHLRLEYIAKKGAKTTQKVWQSAETEMLDSVLRKLRDCVEEKPQTA